MEFRQPGTPKMDEAPSSEPSFSPPTPDFSAPKKTKKAKSDNKKPKQLILWVIGLVLLLAAIGTAAYYVNKYNESQKQVKKLAANPSVVAQNESQQLIASIGKLTELPAGETPTVATVSDISKLKDQVFFVGAKNGDKVLIYTQAKKAILYRPSTNKIINIAPVNYGDSQTQSNTNSNTTTNTNP